MSKHTIRAQNIVLGLCFTVMSAALLPGTANAAELGRLFTTPSERLLLNQMRSAGGAVSMPAASAATPQASPADVPVRFNGFVKRSSGQSDAWINGQHIGSDRVLSRRLGTGNTLRVSVPDSGRSVQMKAGQVMDPFTGSVNEAYEAQKPHPTPAVAADRPSGR